MSFLDVDLLLFEMSTTHHVQLGTLPVPLHMLSDAENDPALSGAVLSRPVKRMSIVVDNTLVGFLSPRKERSGHWRTGAIYVKPEHRSLGYGSMAIQKFFEDKELGLSLIEPANIASQKAFESAGFRYKRTFVNPSDGASYQVWEKR